MKQAEGVKLEPEPRREIRGLRLPSDVAVNLEAGLGPLRGSGTSGDVHDVEDITIDDERRKLVVKVFKKARQKERMYDEVYNSVRAKQMVPEGTIEVVGFTHEMGGRAGKCAIVFVDSGQALSEVRDVANDEDWMSYMKQTLSIATTLFRKGMTHNDINPRNLVVNKQGRVTLIDFGSATFADQPGGRSPTSKGPTEHYWCPIARTSSMSKITGITFPGIDGTQNGFTSDAYSCAVSFGEKYDLRVNSIDGVTVPKIDCLDGGLSPVALEEVLRGLTNKANQRWDVTTLEACAWWEEVGNKFCTEVPSITNAERAALALNGSLLRTDRAATMIEAVESAESAADNLEKAIALLQTSMEGRSAAHGEEGAAETTKAVAAMAAVAGGLKKLRQVLVAHAGEGAGSVPRDGTGTNVAPIEVQATARVVTETQRPGKLGRSNRGLHLASGSSKIAVDIPNGDCLGDNFRKRARDGGDPGSGSSTESEPEPPVRRRKIDAPEEKAVRDELSRHAKDDNNAAVVMADPAAMAPQVADPTSIPARAATVAEESHKSTTQKRARDDSLDPSRSDEGNDAVLPPGEIWRFNGMDAVDCRGSNNRQQTAMRESARLHRYPACPEHKASAAIRFAGRRISFVSQHIGDGDTVYRSSQLAARLELHPIDVTKRSRGRIAVSHPHISGVRRCRVGFQRRLSDLPIVDQPRVGQDHEDVSLLARGDR